MVLGEPGCTVGRSVGCDSRSERMIGGFGCGVGVSLLLFLEEWCEYCCARICAARLFMIMLGRLAGESVGWLGGGLPYRYGAKDWIMVRVIYW